MGRDERVNVVETKNFVTSTESKATDILITLYDVPECTPMKCPNEIMKLDFVLCVAFQTLILR